MSNFNRAVKTLNDVDEHADHLADNDAYVTALEAEGLLAPDMQVIRTQKELEALEIEDADAVVLTGQGGAVWTARVLAAIHRLGSISGVPAVVIATGAQVSAARKALEKEHG